MHIFTFIYINNNKIVSLKGRKLMELKFPRNMHIYTFCPKYLLVLSFSKILFRGSRGVALKNLELYQFWPDVRVQKG